MHEPPGLHPDCFDKIKSFSMENFNIPLNISFWKNFHRREVEKLKVVIKDYVIIFLVNGNKTGFFTIQLEIYQSLKEL